jgi:hypothetical protein
VVPLLSIRRRTEYQFARNWYNGIFGQTAARSINSQETGIKVPAGPVDRVDIKIFNELMIALQQPCSIYFILPLELNLQYFKIIWVFNTRLFQPASERFKTCFVQLRTNSFLIATGLY